MRQIVLTVVPVLALVLTSGSGPLAGWQTRQASPSTYAVVAGWPQLPDGVTMDKPTKGIGGASGVDVDSDGHVWVFHRGAKMPIMEIDGATGRVLRGFGEGMIVHAHGLEVDHEDNVWVTDQNGHQVHKFSPDGKLLLSVGVAGQAGADEKHFDQPTDVAIAPNGDFFVSDGYGNSRVVKFDRTGRYITAWGERGDGPGQFNLPHGLTMDPEGRLYVADRSNLRVQVFTTDGKFLAEWKTDEWARPWGLEYRNGAIWVMDGGHMSPGGAEATPKDRAAVLRLSLQGEVLEKFGAYGTQAGHLAWGHDLTVDAHGNVYTVEVQHGRRVQKFMRKPGDRTQGHW